MAKWELLHVGVVALFVFKGENMSDREILSNIKGSIVKNPYDFVAYEDYFQMLRLIGADEGIKTTVNDNIWLRNQLKTLISENPTVNLTLDSEELLKRTYLYTAKDYFADYMIYLEWNRPPAERFFLPRISVMGKIAKQIQRLADDELDELFFSLPPRVGKTTLIMFLMTWLIGRNSETSNLYSAFSDKITSSFYNGVLEVIRDPQTYLWNEVFPSQKIVQTNGKDETLNIDRAKRYPSLTARSLYGTLNGSCDCNGFMIADDLLGGIEEAMSPDRLMSAWEKTDNNLIPRCKEQAKMCWVGTRWAEGDPIGKRLSTLQNDLRFANRRFLVINTPALNDKGESNFQYAYGVGFSTTFYQQRKASFEQNDDLASWDAQYMGQPVERNGRLFDPAEMKFWNGDLPDESALVRKFMAVDPAFGGGDYVSAPIAYQYDDGSVYIVDVVYSNANKKITQPMIAEKIVRWGLNACQFEANASTSSYAEKVEELVHERKYKLNISYKAAPTNVAKQVRIFDKAPEIKQFFFLESTKRTNEYEQFMANVHSFQINGNNKHDDAPDSLSQLVDMMISSGTNVKLIRRVF